MDFNQLSKKHISYFAAMIFAVLFLALIVLFVSKNRTNESSYVSKISDTNESKSLKEAPESTFPVKGNDLEGVNDKYLTQLQNEDIQLASKQADALAKVPVIKWQNELVANIRNEDINQTIKNIPNFDDTIMALSSLGNVMAPLSFYTQYVTRLARVRKLYAIAQKNPDLIIPGLKKIHQDSLTEWPEAAKKWDEEYKKGKRKISEPDAYQKCMDYCLAATYLLAEFGDYDSLPLLSQQYNIHHIWPPPNLLPAPVQPAITFYAMHRLASTYPRDILSAEAIKTLDEYLKAAKELVPPPKLLEVTVWDSYYVESDPRVEILGVKDEILRSQKTMMMPLYPENFMMKDIAEIQNENGDIDQIKLVKVLSKLDNSARSEFVKKVLQNVPMEDPGGLQSKQLDELFNKLDAFVRIVYPAQGNSSK